MYCSGDKIFLKFIESVIRFETYKARTFSRLMSNFKTQQI